MAEGKQHVSIVICGHVDAGKSTTTGRLIFELGGIGERELQALPRHAFVLNPARGPIIQEAALLRALREGWIAGAALDTHYAYPLPPEHPLWRMENVILTPHISGSGLSPHFLERVWDIFSLNLDRLERAQPLLNELTPAQLAGT